MKPLKQLEPVARLVAAALVALALNGGAQAQPQGLSTPVWAQACADDLRAHCRSVSPGDGRLVACLKQQGPGLSASCQAALPQLSRCSAELQRICGDGGPTVWRSCVKAKQDQISPECRQPAPR